MSADPSELKPRGAAALLDAAVNAVATDLGPWALLLPSGAILTACAALAVDALLRGASPEGPALALALAWAFRGVSQAAAAHHLERQLASDEVLTPLHSFGTALARLPSLVVVAALVLVVDLLALTFSAGLSIFFHGSLVPAFAVAMKHRGPPWGVLRAARELLGPSLAVAPWARLGGAFQLVVAANLQLSVWGTLALAQELLGLDVAYLQRFTALDNPVWVAALVALTFSLFEPVRAAVAALLVVDGRVRQEGLDLRGALERLPRRRAGLGASAVAVLALTAAPAPAQQDEDEGALVSRTLAARLQAALAPCELALEDDDALLLSEVRPALRNAAVRFVARLERLLDEEGCEDAQVVVEVGLAALRELEEHGATASEDPRAVARAILAKDEFQPPAPAREVARGQTGEGEAPAWLREWLERLWRWLAELLRPDERATFERPAPAPLVGTAVALAVVTAVLAALLGAALWRRRREEPVAAAEPAAPSQALASSDDALAHSPPGWAALAEERARRGEHRQAIRLLYLAVLARLHQAGAIHYSPTRSNWDHVRGFRGTGEAAARFREATARFDAAWYGLLGATEAGYLAFRALVEPLVEASS